MKFTALKDRAKRYQEILDQVVTYRDEWGSSLKHFIINKSEEILKQTDINANIQVEERFKNLESITISLGKSLSGISEVVDENVNRSIVKDQGALIYSQLFNGKIQVWMTYPLIEGLMQPKPPKGMGIYAPPEIDERHIMTKFDEFFKELIEWENYDDDQPNHSSNRIGFGMHSVNES